MFGRFSNKKIRELFYSQTNISEKQFSLILGAFDGLAALKKENEALKLKYDCLISLLEKKQNELEYNLESLTEKFYQNM